MRRYRNENVLLHFPMCLLNDSGEENNVIANNDPAAAWVIGSVCLPG